MNKKGTVVLLIISIAFLFSIILFFTSLGDARPGDVQYLGETQVEIYNVYQDAEEYLTYIERGAQLALQKSYSSSTLEDDFKLEFKKYLVKANNNYEQGIELKHYTFTFDLTNGNIKAISSELATFSFEEKDKSIIYSVYPNFDLTFAPIIELPSPVYAA
ncbi:MAG: hypothetical protein ABIF40_00030 [archaeon]